MCRCSVTPSRLVAGLSVFVLAVAAAGYAVYGTPGAWRGVPVAPSEEEAGAGHGGAAEQIAAMVAKLEQRMKDQPDDAEGWSMLGRSYSAMGRYPEAVTAFKRVAALKPKDAQALADQADAVAMAAVQVSALMEDRAKVEIEVTAVIPR